MAASGLTMGLAIGSFTRIARNTSMRNFKCTQLRGHSNAVCWKCSRELLNVDKTTSDQFFCDCEERVVLPPSGRDYFQVLGCSRSFHIDGKPLKQTFLKLQSLLHPDKYAQKSNKELQFAAEQSSLINKAFTTLRKPYARALYLLQLEGVAVKMSHGGDCDHNFLATVMQINEDIDITDDRERLHQMKEDNTKAIEELEMELSRAFQENQYEHANDILAKMKYFQTISDNINEKLNEDE